MSNKKTYTLERLNAKNKWVKVAGWEDGQNSRFDIPFTPEVAVMEARAYQLYYRREVNTEVPPIRIIIEM